MNVGDLMGAVHFKIVRYERIKFLVVGLENSIEIYAWAPKPYHKFMSFKVIILYFCHLLHLLDEAQCKHQPIRSLLIPFELRDITRFNSYRTKRSKQSQFQDTPYFN